MHLNDDQIRYIVETIQGVWHGIMGADAKGGLFKTIRENKVAADHLTEARAEYPNNEAIQQITGALIPGGGDDLDSTGHEAAMHLSFDLNALMTRVTQVSNMVGPGEEGQQVRVFIYELAERIAQAAGTGRFGSGDKFSEEEITFLQQLYDALGF